MNGPHVNGKFVPRVNAPNGKPLNSNWYPTPASEPVRPIGRPGAPAQIVPPPKTSNMIGSGRIIIFTLPLISAVHPVDKSVAITV